jgi:2-amino-4-hydroxy-6-hydroxymethyldihydropteridine diphosphokinase
VSVEIGYLGLGSNVGDRRAYLQAAVEDLWAHRVTVLASSSVYETEPVGEVTDQPEFLNVCVEIECGLAPERLLAACQAVESALGRTLAGEDGYVRHGPRPIDIDILLFGAHRHRSHRLHIPHPELTARRFVLVPLVELAPHLHIPGHGSAAKALAALGDGQQVRCAGAPLDVRA